MPHIINCMVCMVCGTARQARLNCCTVQRHAVAHSKSTHDWHNARHNTHVFRAGAAAVTAPAAATVAAPKAAAPAAAAAPAVAAAAPAAAIPAAAAATPPAAAAAANLHAPEAGLPGHVTDDTAHWTLHASAQIAAHDGSIRRGRSSHSAVAFADPIVILKNDTLPLV
jgi:hypothetical protein